MSVIDIRPGLRAYILADPAIAAIVVDRVFQAQMPQGETRISIVFSEISDVGDYHMQGPSGLAQPRYQIDTWSLSIDAAASLAALLKTRFDGYKGLFVWGSHSPQESVEVLGVFFNTGRDLYDSAGKMFGKSRDYIIWFRER